jgi:hypothetical protein
MTPALTRSIDCARNSHISSKARMDEDQPIDGRGGQSGSTLDRAAASNVVGIPRGSEAAYPDVVQDRPESTPKLHVSPAKTFM